MAGDTPLVPRFDEAQAYAAGREAARASRGLVSHPVLLASLAVLAVEIRRRLEAGETVTITAGGQELGRYEPETGAGSSTGCIAPLGASRRA